MAETELIQPSKGIAALDALFDDSQAALPHAAVGRGLALLALVLLGLALRLPALQHSVSGDHVFRQAVIVAQAISLTDQEMLAPFEGYDAPPTIFSLPFYELLSAGLATATGLEPVVAARILSLLCFIATLLAIHAFLAAAGFDRRSIVLSELFYVISPLSVHYSSAPLADNLGIALGSWSIVFLWRAREAVPGPELARALAIGAGLGVLSTLLKSPIYAFFFGALAIHWLLFDAEKSRSWRRYLALAAVFLAAAFAAELIRSLALGARPEGAFAQDPSWYFGALGDRLDPQHGWRILKRVLLEYGSPLGFLLALAGLWHCLRDRSSSDRIVLSFGLSALALTLVLWNVHRHHNYYQLPFVLAYCLLSARGLLALAAAWRGPSFAWCLLLFLGLSSAFGLFHPIRGLEPLRPAYAALIEGSVPESGFVYFADYESSPSPLLLSQRKGRKIYDRDGLCASQDTAPAGVAVYLFVVPEIDYATSCPGRSRWQPLHALPGIGTLYRLTRSAEPEASG